MGEVELTAERFKEVTSALPRSVHIGQELGLTASQLSNRKHGKHPWRLAELKVLADLCGFPSVEELCGAVEVGR